MKHPLMIGAVGGSGTRVIARIIRHTGFFMGTNLNESDDAMEFVDFYDRWINRFICVKDVSVTGDHTAQTEAEFFDCVARHRALIPIEHMNWGWKEPRSIYLLPFVHRLFPRMKFIHLIRDGRDMAFSSNQNQLKKHGEAILDSKYTYYPQPIKTAMLWSKINLMASDYGEKNMGDRYLRIRFEDLCRDSGTTIHMIYNFLDLSKKDDIDAVLLEVNPPGSIGRWRACHDPDLISGIQMHAKQALVRFGYV